MHARVTYSKTDPRKAPERLRFIKERVAPTASSREGFNVGYWMSDSATGKGLAITFWDSEEAMLASEGMEKNLVDKAIATNVEIAGIEHYEVIHSV